MEDDFHPARDLAPLTSKEVESDQLRAQDANLWVRKRGSRTKAWFGSAYDLAALFDVARRAVQPYRDADLRSFKVALDTAQSQLERSLAADRLSSRQRQWAEQARVDRGYGFRSGSSLRRAPRELLEILELNTAPLAYLNAWFGSTMNYSVALNFSRLGGVRAVVEGPEEWVETTLAALNLAIRRARPWWAVFLRAFVYIPLAPVLGWGAVVVAEKLGLSSDLYLVAFLPAVCLSNGLMQFIVPRFEVVADGKKPFAWAVLRALGSVFGVILGGWLTTLLFSK